MPGTFHMNNDNELKLVDSGSWFHTLITRSEKNTALELCVQFLLLSYKGRPRVRVRAGFHSKSHRI